MLAKPLDLHGSAGAAILALSPPMIRRATVEDVDRIVQMGERFIRETTYRDLLPPDPPAMTVFVGALVASRVGLASVVFVDEREGALVGMLGLFLYQHPMSNQREAVECFWWQEPEYRGAGLRLLREANQWAAQERATVLRMIAPTVEVERLYERLKFRRIETTYAKEIG